MRTNAIIRCTVCGADMKGATVCKVCGKNKNDPQKGLEVEYKDFKISEFLEIRAKRPEALEEVTVPRPGDVSRRNNSLACVGAKNVFLQIVPVIIISAFAAGVICLLDYLSLW